MGEQLLDFNELKPLGELVFNYLRNQILTGGLEPGERLMEVSLSNTLKVSRTPIREAIRKLEKEKFVVIYPRRGAFVADLTESDMKEVLEIRKELEGFAAQLAADRIQPEELKELENHMKGFDKALDEVDKVMMIEHDKGFHDVILNATKNQKLINIISELQDQFQRFRLVYFNEINNFDEVKESHHRIYDAIKEKNISVARFESEKHVVDIEHLVDQWNKK